MKQQVSPGAAARRPTQLELSARRAEAQAQVKGVCRVEGELGVPDDCISVFAGMVVLFVVGQLAVLGPALKAAATPPAIATRTV